MEYTVLIEKLKKWITVIQKALIVTVAFEAILVIIIGIVSNKVTKTFDIWMMILISSSVLYIILSIILTLYQLKFPGSISDELASKHKLTEYDKSFNRQKIINEYINQSVKSLNDQTCSTNVGLDPHLCDEQLQDRLKDVLNPVITNTHILLNSYHVNKFTIGLHLTEYSNEPRDYSNIKLTKREDNTFQIDNWNEEISDQGIILLKDELKLEHDVLKKDLLFDQSVTGVALEIQSAIKRSLNNVEFFCRSFIRNKKDHTIICSDMPLVCSDDEASGVLFIILEGSYEAEEDLPYLLRIFNRVVANYIYKYNDCVFNQVVSKLNNQVESTK